MRLRYTIARDALFVKVTLSGVDMRPGAGVVSYLGFYRYVPPIRYDFFRVAILRSGIILPFVGILVLVWTSDKIPIPSYS